MRFFWNGQKYQNTCFAMGLASAPRIFTKLMKLAFSSLRKQGFSNIAYIDDTLLLSDSKTECVENVKTPAKLLDNLGLTINIEKFIFTPSKEIQFLGFIINSNTMTVSLTDDRAESIGQMRQQILASQSMAIRQ